MWNLPLVGLTEYVAQSIIGLLKVVSAHCAMIRESIFRQHIIFNLHFCTSSKKIALPHLQGILIGLKSHSIHLCMNVKSFPFHCGLCCILPCVDRKNYFGNTMCRWKHNQCAWLGHCATVTLFSWFFCKFKILCAHVQYRSKYWSQ